MSLVKRQFISSKEEYRKDGRPKNDYHRVGELLTFKDGSGKIFHRVKLYLVPNQTFVLFDEKQGDK